MNAKELMEKSSRLADRVGELFTEEDIEIGVVMSVLLSLTVDTGLGQAGMTGTELIRLFAQGVEKYEDSKKYKNLRLLKNNQDYYIRYTINDKIKYLNLPLSNKCV